MKLYHIISLEDPNPVIIASSAVEAGNKYIEKHQMSYVLHDKSDDGQVDTACFVDNNTTPAIWADPNSEAHQRQIDQADWFFVEPVCLSENYCVECDSYRTQGLTLTLFEDVQYLAKLLPAFHRASHG